MKIRKDIFYDFVAEEESPKDNWVMRKLCNNAYY